jgi:hypothetical protein
MIFLKLLPTIFLKLLPIKREIQAKNNNRTTMSVAEETFLELGQEITNRRKRVSAKTEMSRFKPTFGTSPMICALLWGMIISKNSSATKWIQASSSTLGFGFLKLYCAEGVL